MTVQILTGTFNPGVGDQTHVRGSFNGWGLQDEMYQGIIDTAIYHAIVRVDTGLHEYKYTIENSNGTIWENRPPRIYHATGFEPDINGDGIADAILDTVFFDVGLSPPWFFLFPTDIIFEVDMRPAYAYLDSFGVIPFGGASVTHIDCVLIAGDQFDTTPNLRWVWTLPPGHPSLDSLKLNDTGINGDSIPGDTIWSATIKFKVGATTHPEWKFSINAIDNESDLGQFHRGNVDTLNYRIRRIFGENGDYYNLFITSLHINQQVNNSYDSHFQLIQNYPNPFNLKTSMSFEIFEPDNVDLRIYNSLGQEIDVLVDDKKLSVGLYNYDFDASNLSSSIYYFRLKVGKKSETKKMILIR